MLSQQATARTRSCKMCHERKRRIGQSSRGFTVNMKKKWSSRYKYAVKACLFFVCVCVLSIPFLSMFWWPYGRIESGVLLITQKCVQKEIKKKKREREKRNESSHSVLCWYKWRQLFWSHLGVCNSQMEDCLSWCLTVQTQVRKTKMRREQISPNCT